MSAVVTLDRFIVERRPRDVGPPYYRASPVQVKRVLDWFEVSFRDTDGPAAARWERRTVFRFSRSSADEAYRIALDGDEKAGANGITIYNERHPRPQPGNQPSSPTHDISR